MSNVYVVKTGEKYLCSAEDGDIGLAPDITEARRFLSREDAEKTAKDHADPDYQIIAVAVPKR